MPARRPIGTRSRLYRVIHAFPALGNFSRLSLGRVRAKRAAGQGGRRSTRPRRPAWPGWCARPRRQRIGENEEILNAYALNPGGAIDFKDERNVTFRPKQRPTVLVLACIAVAQEPSVEDRALDAGTGRPGGTGRPSGPGQPGDVSVEDRACITAAAAKLPNIATLKVERSRALPQPSAQGRRDPTLSNVKVEIDVSVAGQSSTYVFNCVRQGQLVVVQPMGMR